MVFADSTRTSNMHFFELRDIQHFISYLFPALLTVLVFGAALAYSHFRRRDSEERKRRVYYKFPGDIEDREAPFPLVLILIIAGILIWAFSYILGIGLLGVKI
jgi:hypothetical protein